jgi:exopolyphosphatase/guanosine-5'-triphosphate,3'-diphosphate pyrophosphatase
MSSGKSDPKRIVIDAIEDVRWLREETGKTFYAVGGAWRSFARLHMEQAGYPLHIIHHYDIPSDEARAVARLIAVQSAKSLEKMPGVSRRRVDTLPLACLALDRLLAALKPRNVVFSAFGLREGFYYSRLSEAERARHPLIAFAEEQGADWRRFDLSPQEIFDWLTPVFAGESDAERILRIAACHLSDISWNDHPDYRAEQAYIRVLHLPAPGMSHRERAILAMTLAYRYKSDSKSAMLDTALRLADNKGRNYARRLGACLRLAYNLSGGAPGLLPQVQLRRTERDLRMIVPAELKRSLGDVTARRLESAAEAFDLKSVIVAA